MKNATKFLLLILLLGWALETQAQNTTLFWFRSGTACPLATTSLEIPGAPPLVAMDDMAEGNSLTCVVDSRITTTGWSTGASVNTATDPYISFGFTVQPGFMVVFDGLLDKIFAKGLFRDADGPTQGQFFYSYNGGTLTAIGSPFTIGISSASFDDIVPAHSVDEGETMEFRFYAWNAAATSGNLTLLNFEVLNDGALPVELVSFDALADGSDIHLTWETASELNNAGFYVEVSPAGLPHFEQLGFVEGYGTTEQAQNYKYTVQDLAPGPHLFRLKQVDYDGTFEYSPEVEVSIELANQFVIESAYPNPFNPQAQFRFAVKQTQQVEVGLYDVLGHQVQTLYAGRPAAQQMETVQINGRDLPSGLYIIRVVGEQFVQAQTITLVK